MGVRSKPTTQLRSLGIAAALVLLLVMVLGLLLFVASADFGALA